MLDIISYWLVYTVLAVGVLSFPLYWLCDLIDVIIKDLTNGRFVNAFSDKFRNTWLSKLGLHNTTYGDKPTNKWRTSGSDWADLALLLSIIILIVACIGFGAGYGCYQLLPYEVLAKITSVITPYMSTPVLLVVGYVLVRGVIKKAFTKYEDLESKLKKLD